MKNKIVLLALCFCSTSFAQEIPEFSGFFKEELANTESAVVSCTTDEGSSPAPAPSVDDSWFLRRFWLRIRPKAVFKVPGFAKLEIVPEVELLWQRELPTGMTSYKPL